MEETPKQNTGFFDKIQKLFSTDVILNAQSGGQLKVVDINKIQSSGEVITNSVFDRFNKVYTTSGRNQYNTLNSLPTSRIQLYTDYEAMDTDAIIASALDIISDEVGLKNDFGEVLQIRSSDDILQKLLYNLFYDILNIEYNLWSWTRSMCKYGDFYLKLEISEEYGVYNVIPFSSYTMIRTEGDDPTSPQEVKFIYDPTFASQQSPLGHQQMVSGLGTNKVEFKNYEISHFRLLSDYNYLPYGRSYLEPARKIFKQLNLMEDAMLIHRIVRAPEKRTFYINVGNIPPNEVEQYMQKTINKMKKTPYIDQKTGEYNLKYNVQNILEDFYIPVRGNDTSTKIETTKGLDYAAIDDVNYLKEKLFAALRVPKAYLGYEADLSGKCISPDTLIPLLDGRIITVDEIINEFNNGIKNYVYSLDETTNNIVPGEIEWAGFTRLNTQVLRVWLDNKKYIDCTPDHKFLTRDGEWKEAQDLKESESLMPLYLKKSIEKKINGYTEVYHPSTGKYEFVHRLVANYYGLKEEGKVIHHSDCNKLNNNPENLNGSMDFWEHRKWHVEHAMMCHTEEASLKRKNTWVALGQNNDYRESQKEIWKNNSENLVKWIKENGASRKGYRKNPDGICAGCKNPFDKTSLTPEQQNNIYCSQDCRNKFWKGKFNNITLEVLKENALLCKNFKELMISLNIKDHTTLRKVFDNLSINKEKFIIEYMPLAHSNSRFMNQFPLTNDYYNKGEYKNHKVLKIEWLENKIDTCDLTISKYHNFGTEAGVIIHNSTLAAEDIRFARTVERIQRIIVSELTRIAIVHLYAQGYDGESLTNFTLSLTPPSIIYDQERIALLKEKTDLAISMVDNTLLPSDWVYDNIFNFSQNQYEEYRDLIVEDKKRKFRYSQIEAEGNDPAESGEAFGTPHILAALNKKGKTPSQGTPKGYDENNNEIPSGPLPDAILGRPEERSSIINTQDSALGKDKLGSYQMKNDNTDGTSLNPPTKQGALRLETTENVYKQHKDQLKNMFPNRRINLFEESDILNPSNILTEDKLI